ncbi:hypothetical protein [Ferrimonas gelatinilytica]|uniref:Bacterial surface antigen (D15) domain-containing protein n=1 Tax=Ferrimonas gelatinilytica TaxID=1255257 RepID=A0ABP9S6I9_9GAMM
MKFLLPLVPLLTFSATLAAQESGSERRNAAVPILFSTSSMGFSLGAAASLQGLGQSQAQVVGVGAYSVNQSYVAYLGAFNYRLGKSRRWFVDWEGFVGQFNEKTLYLDGPEPGSVPAGSNGSAIADALFGEEQHWEINGTLRYLLPLGAGRDDTTLVVATKEGLPMVSPSLREAHQGAYTFLELKPFYERHSVQALGEDFVSQGMTLRLEQDARNFWPSPTAGYQASLELTRDWGSDQREAYTRWEAQYRHYLNLGQSRWAKQQSMALTAYLSDLPTWEGGSSNPEQAPAWFAQSTLGGWHRLRGYSSARYHDRSALYYGAEYRMVPRWQPQGGIPFINRYRFPWYELALFGGVGRVNEDFDLGELHKDMQWSAGVGIRLWVENVLVRLDFAVAADDSGVVVAINQPF